MKRKRTRIKEHQITGFADRGKKILAAVVALLILTSISVFAVGLPEVFSAPASAGNYKQCDCECRCNYWLSGECTFKRGT